MNSIEDVLKDAAALRCDDPEAAIRFLAPLRLATGALEALRHRMAADPDLSPSAALSAALTPLPGEHRVYSTHGIARSFMGDPPDHSAFAMANGRFPPVRWRSVPPGDTRQ